MRMWMINPKLLCNQHLLGEHGELHKFKPSFEKCYSMDKRIRLRQIFPQYMKQRHDILAYEMLQRGMNHQSPYTQPNIDYITSTINLTYEDIKNNIQDLRTRCPECKRQMDKMAF